MVEASQRKREAYWTPPAWFFGGNGSQFFRNAGLRAVKVGNQYRIQSEERYFGRAPKLLNLESIAGPTGSEHYSRLQTLAQAAVDVNFKPAAWDMFERFRERTRESAELVDLASYIRGALSICPPEEVEQVARWSIQRLRAIPLQSDPATPAFAHASLYAIARSEKLALRLMPAKLELRLQQDPGLSPASLSSSGDGLIFQSSAHILDGTSLLQTYIAPLQGALTPAVWCLSASRTMGPIVLSLGRAVAGTRGECAELLQTLSSTGPTSAIAVPKFTEMSTPYQAISWWTLRLNELLSALTDPSTFTTVVGEFDIDRQVQALASVEQLFSRVTAMQAAHRDRDARETLLFSALDTIETLTGHNFDLLCSYDFVLTRYEELVAALPRLAGKVLLPAALRGLDALAAVQEGFFLAPRPTQRVELHFSDGTTKVYAKQDAAAQYLKLRRNATHGHGTNRKGQENLTKALLAQHNGQLHHDLGLLAYLHLLWILLRTEVLERRWTRS